MTSRRQTKHLTDGGKQAEVSGACDAWYDIQAFYKEVWPKILKLKQYGNIEAMIETYTPIALMNIGEIAMKSKSDKVRLDASTELVHLGIGKPVQKVFNLNGNVDNLHDDELNSLLTQYLKDLPEPQRKAIANMSNAYAEVIEVKKDE